MKRRLPGDIAGVGSPSPSPQGDSGSLLSRTADGRSQGSRQIAIPDYELVRRIGGGSYGEVWLARSVTGAYRAIKIVYRHTFLDDRPFEREFNGIQKFEPISRSHDSQMDILHIGRNNDSFYYVMELADDAGPERNDAVGQSWSRGKSLADPNDAEPCHRPAAPGLPDSIHPYIPHTLKLELQRRGRLPMLDCLEIGIGLTTALANLHKHGLVHRDVKLSNVIFIDGTAKLADIGLVTDFDATVSCVGTEGYLPREGPGTRQADLYALGKVLYEISSGKDRKDYPEPPTLLGEFSNRQELLELGEVVKRACATNPRDRYGTAEQMQADLLLLKTGKSVRQTRMLERRLKIMTRTVAAVVAVMLLGVVPYAWALLEARRARQAAIRAQAAEAASRERLGSSYLAQAHAWRLTSQAGRRAEALKVLKAAAEIRPSLELRNEAIACLALLDLQVKKVWPPSLGFLGFDSPYERCVRGLTNGVLSIRRVEDDVELMRLPGYEPPGPGVSPFTEFSPNGRFLAAVCGADASRLELWDLEGPTRIERFPNWFCRTVAFRSDSRRAALSLTVDKLVKCPILIYDLTQRRTIATLEHGSLPSSLCFHPTKNLLATSSTSSREVQVWDLASGTVVQRFSHLDSVFAVDWAPDGNLLASACGDNKVYLWDPAKPEWPERTLVGHDMAAVAVSFSFDGAFIASRGWDGAVRIWDPSTGQQLFKYLVPGYTGKLSRPHYRFFHALGAGTAISELALSRACRLLRLPASGGTRAETCGFSPDGKWLMTAHEDGVRIWNVASGKVSTFLPEQDTYASVFGPGQNHCLIASKSGITKWTLTRDVQGDFEAFTASKMVSSAATRELLLSRDESILAFPVAENVHVLELANGRERTVLRSDDYWSWTTISGDGRLAVGLSRAFGEPAPVRIFDLATTNLLHELSQNAAGRATFSPDGKWLLIGDHLEYRLWNTDSWLSPYALPKVGGGLGYLGFMAFSPDSAQIALVQNRDTVRLVEAISGNELATLVAPEAHDIGGLTFSPDGTQLAVLYGPGPIQLWDLRLIRQELATMSLDWKSPVTRR
jgi:WD40 repeat protein